MLETGLAKIFIGMGLGVDEVFSGAVIGKRGVDEVLVGTRI
jgi:hypothetical protein